MDKLLAFKNLDTFRAIQAQGPAATNASLAEALARDPSNMNKTLGLLVADGLITRDPFALTEKAEAVLRADDVAEGRASLTRDTSDPANLSLRHADILPDPDNARRDWTSDDAVADLQALANDIRDNGLLQNLIVRPHADPLIDEWILVGGERRWRALGLLIERGEWLAEQTVPARRLHADDVGIRLAALAENLQRRALNPIEEANAYRGLEAVGLTTKEIAARISMTQRHVQMRLQLLDLLNEDQQRRMTLPSDDKDRLSVSEARKLVANAEAKARAREQIESELSPRARLILAEVKLAGPGWWDRVPVDAIAMNADADAVALNQAGYLKLPTTVDLDGNANTVIESGGFEAVTTLFNHEVAARAAALRAELGLPAPEDGRYSTAWLNGPFELPAEVEADLAARRAERERQEEEQQARIDANIAAREAAANRAALSRVHAEAMLFKAAVPPAAPIIDDVPQLAASLDRRLPWAATDKGTVHDADGKQITSFCGQWQSAGDREIALAILTATAVNTAAGVETPPLIVAEPEQAADGSDADAEDDDEPEADD
jgi:ParB/RepB/Spo0J family partition protein